MARADRRSAQRAKPAAAARRSDVVIEDTMFFPRLRRHAKWMFLFLALAFGLGFVGFGVGAGGVGVGDVFRDAAGGSGVPSISDSEQKVLDNPKDAQAFKDLATAYQAEGDIDEAVEAMTSYVALKPKDTDALRELAALYLQKASTAQERAQIYQVRVRLPRSRDHPGHDLPARRQPALARPDHERRQHVVRARDLRRRVGDPGEPRRRRSRRIARSPRSSRPTPPSSSSSPRPRSRPTTPRP